MTNKNTQPVGTGAHPPPSVGTSEPLLSSYLYSTSDRVHITDEEEKLKRDDWIMGIDEAGRGPVLGPMVYGAAFCTQAFAQDKLVDLGFADSKTLTHKRREELLEMIVHPPIDQPLNQRVEWNVKVLTPADISQGMNRRTPYNLNAQAFDATCEIIQHALDRRYNLQHIYVDTLGPPKTHQMKLEHAFPGIKFTVCSKADSIYPIVGAASVVAKVTRDAIVSHWIHPESTHPHKRKFSEDEDATKSLGSGYPSDPNTVKWLSENFNTIFGFGQLVRFSWGTIKTLLAERGPAFNWQMLTFLYIRLTCVDTLIRSDEPPSIQKWFKPVSQAQTATATAAFCQDLGLTSVDSL
ncbi:ribonuclease HII [Puccinia sorghi]|uniref:Ribonuclease n=1 Tax=Puccinia sorghi TaxID=27349 RepID=A0A0L6URH1_9BASI|nr:ribonuclease HII [Puccinia sorghi]